MKDRIIKNEDRLDNILDSISDLNKALNKFKSNKRNIYLLNKYYGSKSWFKDKEDFENKKITNIKAGVLSEDSIWNMNEDISDLLEEMKIIIESYTKD